jgi:hypothetical protein
MVRAVASKRERARRVRRDRRRERPAGCLTPATVTFRTANGHDAVSVSPAAASGAVAWVTLRTVYGEREAVAEMLVDKRQLRAVARLLRRAARRLTGDSCRRSTVRIVETAFRAAEQEWLAERNGVEYPENI